MMSKISSEQIASLNDYADSRSYSRGRDYFEQGNVEKIKVIGDSVTATVGGSRGTSYKTVIKYEDDDPDFSCNCPVGSRGDFCKHLVATVLAWSNSDQDKEQGKDSDPTDINSYLRSLKKDELVEIILVGSGKFDDFSDFLLAKANSKRKKGGIDKKALKDILKRSFYIRDFVGYDQSWDFAQQVDLGLDALDEIFVPEHYQDCIELAEYAMKLAEEAIQSMDDSAGHMSVVFERIENFHFAACEKVNFGGVELANRLFGLCRQFGFGQFWGCLDSYGELLKAEGQKYFRNLVEKGWETIPQKLPKPESKRFDFSSDRVDADRHFFEQFMKQFAELDNDIGLLISIESRDLSHEFNIARISRLCREANQPKEALKWIAKGVSLFGKKSHGRDHLINEEIEVHLQLDDFNSALSLAMGQWRGCRSFANYERVKQIATKNNSWQQYRKLMFDQLNTDLQDRKGEVHSSSLVAMHIWEEQFEDAWSVAVKYGCSEVMWSKLATLRESEFPLDVVPIYQRQFEQIIRPRNVKEYPRAAAVVAHIGKLLKQAGEVEQFEKYCAEIRLHYKRMPSLMKALDADKGVI